MSKFPTAKVVSNTTAGVAIKIMQRHISSNDVPRRPKCDQAQSFRAKNCQLFFQHKKHQFIFALVDDHRENDPNVKTKIRAEENR